MMILMNTLSAPLPPAQIRSIVRMLLCFLPLVGMGIDLIAPSLPAMSHALHISPMLAKDLIAIYLLGLMVGTFLSGILSDAWGRRYLMCGGFSLLAIVSVLPPLWPHPVILLLSRLLQGFAIGTFSVLIRSVVTDLLAKEALVRTASWIATMWGVGPIIGPIIGGYLQVYIGWQANFLFFAAYGLIGAIACIGWLPETHHRRTVFSFKRIKNNFVIILSNKVFVSISLLMGCFYSVLIVFNTLAPFFIQKELGYSPIFFGRAAFVLGIIFLSGTFCCRVLVKQFTPQKILATSLPIVLVFAILSILVAYSSHTVWTVLVLNAILFFFCGVIYPTCMGANMNMFRELAGSAGAIVTLINLFVTTSSGFLSSFISAHSAKPIAYVSTGFILLGWLVYSRATCTKPTTEITS